MQLELRGGGDGDDDGVDEEVEIRRREPREERAPDLREHGSEEVSQERLGEAEEESRTKSGYGGEKKSFGGGEDDRHCCREEG